MSTGVRPSDAIIRVRFLTTAEGGRQTDLIGEEYSCPMFIDNQAFDCRIALMGNRVVLGQTYDLPVRFLDRAAALPLLSCGKSVRLWEGKHVANAEIVQLGVDGG